MRPRSINIFLLDGDPDGIRIAQISMSTIQAIAFRKLQMKQVRGTFPELARPGVYMLLGFDIPNEGSEDYKIWTSRASEIDDISSFRDVYAYLQEDDDRAEEFFASFGISDFRLAI